MPDKFSSHGADLESPALNAAAITPHDTNELSTWTRAIYVGTGGNIVLVTAGGSEVTFTAVPQGAILPVRAKIVKNTSTTASNLVALW